MKGEREESRGRQLDVLEKNTLHGPKGCRAARRRTKIFNMGETEQQTVWTERRARERSV